MPLKPITRTENFLARAAGDEAQQLTPITRKEQFYARIAGDPGEELEPITRTEHFLQRIIDAGGGGGGGSTTVVALTATQNKKYVAPEGMAYNPVTVDVPIPEPSGTKQISISANGTTTENVADYASAEIIVNVPNSYAAEDEGKVVSNGALVSQGSTTYTDNGTYNTTLYSSVTVSIPSASGVLF